MSTKSGSHATSHQLDMICAIACAMVPIGIVIGTVVFEFFVSLAGVLWIANCTMNRYNPFPDLKVNGLFIALLSFAFAIYLSVCINGPGDKGLLNDLAFLRFFVFAVALMDISKRIPVEKYMIVGLLAAIVLGAINTLTAHIFGFDLLGKPFTRYAAKGNEALRIAGVCTYAGSFFLSWGALDRDLNIKNKVLVWMAFFVSIPLVFKTGIRSLFISMIIAMLWVLFLFTKNRISKLLAVTIILATIAASAMVVESGKIHLTSFWDRIHIWKVNFTTWQEHPLVGVGPFAYRSAYKKTMNNADADVFAFEAPDGTVYNHPEITFHSHNLLMMLLTTTGLCGTLSFFGIICIVIRKLYRNHGRWRHGLITWPIVLFSVGITGYNIYDPWYQSLFVFFIVLVGIPEGQSPRSMENFLDIQRKPLQSEIGL